MEKTSVAKGGILVEEKMFRWEIKNFDIIVKNAELLDVENVEFDFTDSNGVKSCWRFWFDWDYPDVKNEGEEHESEKREEVLMLNYQLAKKPGYCSEMNIEMVVTCEDAVGTKIFEDSSTEVNLDDGTSGHASCRHSVDDNSWHWEINKLNPKKNLELIGGTLIVLIKLKAFTKITTVLIEEVKKVNALNENRDERFRRMIAKLENDEKKSDVKIISSDGQQFFAYRWILSEESEVFEAMFRSEMKENRTGEVKLHNLSGSTVRLLLHFIYTRELGDEWSAPEVVEEFIEAVDQYQIKPLKDFLDSNLGKACTTENACKLLQLAERSSLKKAEGDILAFIRVKCNHPQGFFEIVKSAKLD